MTSIVVGTAGHIDHGKSSLVQALTGTDPDRLKEEKARGITIDLGFAHWTSGDVHVAFVDVPGHERFVRNMLAGAGGIDAVLLVVAADESIMPQTREHFEICRLLGITRGIVALTKQDLVDEETVQLVRLEVTELLQGTALEEAQMVAVSARTGHGLDALRRALVDVARHAAPRAAAGAARLPIDRAFTMKGFGTVVTGTLVSGRIRQDEDLLLLPGERAMTIRGLQVHGERRDAASAGERAAVNLGGGVDVGEVLRGQCLVTPHLFEASRVIDVHLELLASTRPLRHGARVRFHQGTAELLGRVALLPGEPVEGVPPGQAAYARIRLEAPAVLTRGDRFILRAYSPPVTIGGGVVLDPHAPRTGVRSASARERFARLAPVAGDAPDDGAIALMAEERGIAGLAAAALTARAGVAPGEVGATTERLRAGGLVDAIQGMLFAPGLRTDLGVRLHTMVRDYHRAHPLSEGLAREEARERLFAHAAPVLFDQVLADLAASGGVTGRDRLVAAGHALSLSPIEANARDVIESELRDGGLKPAEPAAIAATHRIAADVRDRVLALLVRQKVAVKIEGLYFHQAALEALKDEVRALKDGGADARVDVASFKERYGITRKFAIPLLEYLDRERVTRRAGEARIVL
jgi:selenocysteine-specific elongation factor